MKPGQRVGIQIYQRAAKLLLGPAFTEDQIHWLVEGKVADMAETPIGVWIDVHHILVVGRPDEQGKRELGRIAIFPRLCVIRWDYIITVILLGEADKPEDAFFGFRPQS